MLQLVIFLTAETWKRWNTSQIFYCKRHHCKESSWLLLKICDILIAWTPLGLSPILCRQPFLVGHSSACKRRYSIITGRPVRNVWYSHIRIKQTVPFTVGKRDCNETKNETTKKKGMETIYFSRNKCWRVDVEKNGYVCAEDI